MIKTSDFAPGGTSSTCKGGLISLASQVNLSGIFSPAAKALLLTLSCSSGGPAAIKSSPNSQPSNRRRRIAQIHCFDIHRQIVWSAEDGQGEFARTCA